MQISQCAVPDHTDVCARHPAYYVFIFIPAAYDSDQPAKYEAGSMQVNT